MYNFSAYYKDRREVIRDNEDAYMYMLRHGGPESYFVYDLDYKAYNGYCLLELNTVTGEYIRDYLFVIKKKIVYVVDPLCLYDRDGYSIDISKVMDSISNDYRISKGAYLDSLHYIPNEWIATEEDREAYFHHSYILSKLSPFYKNGKWIISFKPLEIQDGIIKSNGNNRREFFVSRSLRPM